MSWQNKWSDRDTKEGSAGDKSIRNKRVQQLKKITSLALLCGSLKKHKARTQLPEEKRKPLRRIGHKEPKLRREDSCCARPGLARRMCPKCEIVTCRKCDTLHADALFVAHSLLDHYDA
ncbi:uncharacterized protein C17orf50 homolog isoform X1 [Ascaphus truei]|uniref:uncharacterized protein C17orf50 homolog isoform X1 n=1 Tax=Ascaphus truei TaxID=8439 RepID=UPI003F5A2061